MPNPKIEKFKKVLQQGIDVATANGDLLVIQQPEELRNSLPQDP